MFKWAVREIKAGLGRYLAIFAIAAIGVGFYAGLSICEEAMVTTADGYLRESDFYDYRVVSTLGFTDEDVESFRELDFVSAADGAYFADALVLSGEVSERVFRVMSMVGGINKVDLLYGEMPVSGNECVADAQAFGKDDIGKTIAISPDNGTKTLDALAFDEYMIVGVGAAPQYMNTERGSSNEGAGRVAAFICVPDSGFSGEYFHEVYMTVNGGGRIYSDEYKELIEKNKPAVAALAERLARERYRRIVADMEAGLSQYPPETPAGLDMAGISAEIPAEPAVLEAGLSQYPSETPTGLDMAGTSAEIPAEPTVFVLTRQANAAYVSFENDSAIIRGIARVFPVFFFLVAALMCVTTMSRMVEEQRAQIGVLKSLGYGGAPILGKYSVYAGSAGIFGCLAGYIIGTGLFPQAMWKAFGTYYRFAGRLKFVFDGGLLAASLAVTCVCTVGAAALCCSAVLRGRPAGLVRPKAGKAGGRTWLEYVTPVWRRLSFLHKVTMRNIFRYKQRFFMMIAGIGGCTALLVAGFGILDSLRSVVPDQYGKITLYDAELSFTAQDGSAEAFAGGHADAADGIKSLRLITTASADLSIRSMVKNIPVIAPDTGGLDGYMALRSPSGGVGFPKTGEIIVNSGLAKDMGISVGDKVTLAGGSLKSAELTVSGVFDNHIGNFAYVSRDTAALFFDSLAFNGAYALFTEGADADETAAALLADENVNGVSGVADAKKSIDNTLKNLGFIILIIILCAGALAFVVMYNLTSININERLREIASLKVLGFYDNETSHYIFRENNILTALGAFAGLIIGKLLHVYVMAQVTIEFMKFSTYVNWKSYVYSAALTLAFAFIMQIAMNRRLTGINMAESLKAVE